MKIMCGGVPFEDIQNFKSLAVSLENDCNRLEELSRMFDGVLNNSFTVGTEGILLDTVKTAYRVPKEAGKMGKKAYSGLNKQYRNMKNKWKTQYKPLLVKIIKEMGAVLQSMFAKFSKLGSRYHALGQKITHIRKFTLNQIGTLPSGVNIKLHDFEAYVLKGYIEVIADYKVYYEAVLDSLAPDYVKPEDIVRHIKSKNIREIEKASKSISEAIGSINEFGEITIPWKMFKDRRYGSFFKSLINWKPSKDDMKGSLSDFVKRTILSKEVDYTFEVNDGDKLKQLGEGYLKVVESILNNKVLENALNTGGTSIKSATKELVEDLDQVSNNMNATAESNDDNNDESRKDPEAKVSQGDPMDNALDSYVMNTNNMINKVSVAYTGIVRGTLSAMFDIIAETEFLVNIIENSAGKEMNK
ncbi:MAG: hypothetical protein ACRCX8_12485 [Sarcina sp.]